MKGFRTRDLRKGGLGVVLVHGPLGPLGYAARAKAGPGFTFTSFDPKCTEPRGPFDTIGDAAMAGVPEDFRAALLAGRQAARDEAAAIARWADDGGRA